jgi:hypothetical protein
MCAGFLSSTSIVSEWRPFSFIFNWGTDSMVGGGRPWWKRKCEMVYCRDATASSFVPKVRDEVFALDCLICQDEFFNLLDVKENDEHAHDFALHLSRLFQPALNQVCLSNILYAHAFFPDRLSNHCQGPRHTFPRFA